MPRSGKDNGATEPVSRGTAGELNFAIEIDATRDLAIGASRVDALVTVTARPTGLAAATAAPRLAEVLIMDRSLSMDSKDAVPDGAFLGIIAGNRTAESVFPSTGGLASINAKTRAAAKLKVTRLRPAGGTEIGQWLVFASQLFATEPAAGAIRHPVLYTDG